ncbi:hypothetical protein BN946_scf184851.g31 [Trametes cinnabarina]|uniref:Aldehyde dehydrogenase domain-containing protein n=1 Tax=Pycnoporus cinnabarinus TaxID=5643 RepID=A0A060SB79_PYCCI|nr:hypothetical protein BN946_scf184851.g31 [Trametes cinnabarina]
MSLPFTPLYVNGEWRPASTGHTFEVRNPTTGKVVGTTASASAEDCAAAIEAAALAFQTWENSPLSLRRDILLKAADFLASEEYKAKIMKTVNEETSATADTVVFNHVNPVNELRSFAGATTRLQGESFVSYVPGGQVFVQRKALGVVLGIAPWNSPIGLTLKSIVLPLVCGNTVVFKCSEISPRTQAIVVEVLEKAGLPKGVVNFVGASREDSPARVAQIIAHPAVRKINFTGSDTIGKLIAAEAAKYLKPCVFELGGKSPVVVLEDADIPRAARAITSSALLHSGQICMSTERVIIQKGAADALLVIALAIVDTIEDAVAAANATSYSLVAGLWTKDVHTAFDVASRIRAGCTNINGPTIHVEWMRSHGGLGGSTGYGHFMIDDWTDLRMLSRVA